MLWMARSAGNGCLQYAQQSSPLIRRLGVEDTQNQNPKKLICIYFKTYSGKHITHTHIKKRLELLYPNQHQLEIKQSETDYIVSLVLILNSRLENA